MVFRTTPKEIRAHQRYRFIFERHNKRWTIKLMCKILGVSVSGYYKYKKNIGKPSKDDILSAAMESILIESPFNDDYGAPCMQLALAMRGLKAGIRRIKRIMREHRWLHQPHRKPQGLTHATTEI